MTKKELQEENTALRNQVEAAREIITRGVALMTHVQIGEWWGVRAFLEQDTDAYR